MGIANSSWAIGEEMAYGAVFSFMLYEYTNLTFTETNYKEIKEIQKQVNGLAAGDSFYAVLFRSGSNSTDTYTGDVAHFSCTLEVLVNLHKPNQ